jgi:coenzyme F420 hydrogenase subunit beta
MTFFDEEAASAAVFGLPYDKGGLGHVIDVLASRSASEEIASSGQGGGTVTTLMITALETGLIDAAVLTAAGGDDGFPQGVVAVTPDEIRACAGSRFVGAHSLMALRRALDLGYQRIGVVGVPCQVRSLRKMGLYDLKAENLRERISLVIGLFCNWSFSSRDFASALVQKLGDRAVRKLDIPPPPANVLTLVTDDGTLNVSLDELRPIIQDACRNCSDMTSEFADLSVGMFEGRPGWNTLIIRTPSGRALIEKARDKGRLYTEPFPEQNLAHLRQASLNKKERASAGESLAIGSY